MIKVGIVGTGSTVSIANKHLAGYEHDSRCEVTAVFNRSLDSAQRWVSEHGLNAAACESFEELLERVDAVDICSPNSSHFEYARSALLVNKHLLVEKPLALELSQAEELARLAGENSVHSATGFVYRFAQPIMELKRLADENIGRIYTTTLSLGGKRLANPGVPSEWRMKKAISGSGALGDFSSHLVDICNFALGQRFTGVSCMCDTFIKQREGPGGSEPVETDDAAALILTSDNGLCSMSVSRVGMDELSLIAVGEGGMVSLSMRKPDTLLYWEKKPGGAYIGSVREIPVKPQEYFDGWFDLQMAAFIDGICGKESPAATIGDGLYVQTVIDAAERSAMSGNNESIKILEENK